MEDPIERLEQEGCQGQVADLLRLKVPVNLLEPRVLAQLILEALQDLGVDLDIPHVAVDGVNVEGPEQDVAKVLAILPIGGVATSLFPTEGEMSCVSHMFKILRQNLSTFRPEA